MQMPAVTRLSAIYVAGAALTASANASADHYYATLNANPVNADDGAFINLWTNILQSTCNLFQHDFVTHEMWYRTQSDGASNTSTSNPYALERVRPGKRQHVLGTAGDSNTNAALWGAQNTADNSQFTVVQALVTVPNSPPSNGSNFVSYWAAIQSRDTSDWIAQAVLVYGNHVQLGLTDQWYMQAYVDFGPNYPTGQPSGPAAGPAVAVNPGDVISLAVTAQYVNVPVCDSTGTCFPFDQWYIETYDTNTSQSSTFQVVLLHETTQAAFAQEWGGVNSCADTPSGVLQYANLWTGPASPAGYIPQANPTAINLITGNNAPFNVECPYNVTVTNDSWQYADVAFTD